MVWEQSHDYLCGGVKRTKGLTDPGSVQKEIPSSKWKPGGGSGGAILKKMILDSCAVTTEAGQRADVFHNIIDKQQ